MVSYVSRGKSLCMGTWNGPIYQQGKKDELDIKKQGF